MNIEYKKGDVLQAASDYAKSGKFAIIIHCCNDENKWGAGFVVALSRKWKEPEKEYHKWYGHPTCCLGNCQYIAVEKNLGVVNMIGQKGIGFKNGKAPIRYDAIDTCLAFLHNTIKHHEKIKGEKYTVFAPKFGAGLAGGDWKEIEKLIVKNLCNNNIEVKVYEL